MVGVRASESRVGVTVGEEIGSVVGTPHIVWAGPITCRQGLQRRDVGRECHAEVVAVDQVQEGLDHRFACCQVCVGFALPHAVVSVEVSCDDNMLVVWYVVVREPPGKVVRYRFQCCVVFAVVVNIENRERAVLCSEADTCDVSALELDLLIVISREISIYKNDRAEVGGLVSKINIRV